MPAGLFEKVDPAVGQKFDTPAFDIELIKTSYNMGYGWRMTIKTK